MKSLLKKYRLEPRAFLDQHFLVNDGVIDKIISLLDVNKNDVILEIGAGIGTITKRLKNCKKVVAVEIDKKLSNAIKEETKKNKNIEIINDNILKIIDTIKFNKIISSTPYAICEPLTQKMFFLDFERAVLLLPKKFVDNIKGKKTKLGLVTEAFLDIEVVGDVSKDDFYPAPNVDTVIVLITKNKKDCFVKQLYLQRDKKLKNALLDILVSNYKITKKQAKDRIKKIGISENVLDKKVEKLKKEEYEKAVKSCPPAERDEPSSP